MLYLVLLGLGFHFLPSQPQPALMLDKVGVDRTYTFQNSDPLLKKMGPWAEVRDGTYL